MTPHIEFGSIGVPELLVMAVGLILLWGVGRLKSK
jgi:hypothetical protein